MACRHLRQRGRLPHDAWAQRAVHQQWHGTFTDRTKEYGLDFTGLSTQALFFDYDGDGDLDMYLLTHSPTPSGHPVRARQATTGRAGAGDRSTGTTAAILSM